MTLTSSWALSHLRDAPNIDAARLATIAQRSTSEAQGVLERLALARLVAPTARTAARALPTYVHTGSTLASLGRAVRYHVRRADETDRKVADHIREYGHVTNQTLRRMPDVDVAGARGRLRARQQRGVIVKLDQGRGRPGIWYGRGPKMPVGKSRSSRSARESADQLALDELERATDE